MTDGYRDAYDAAFPLTGGPASLVLGYGWWDGRSWPDRVVVSHEGVAGEEPRAYVPERTCEMVDNGRELCCSVCDWRHDYDDEPVYCSGCGAKVVVG